MSTEPQVGKTHRKRKRRQPGIFKGTVRMPLIFEAHFILFVFFLFWGLGLIM